MRLTGSTRDENDLSHFLTVFSYRQGLEERDRHLVVAEARRGGASLAYCTHRVLFGVVGNSYYIIMYPLQIPLTHSQAVDG